MNKYLIQVFLVPFIKKSLFGKEFIYFNDFLNQSYIISQYCLTLGYLYRNDFETFAQLISAPNADLKKVSIRIAIMGESLYKDYFNDAGNTYDLFIDFQKKRYNELLNIKNEIKIEYETETYLKNKNKLPLFVITKLTDLLCYSFIGFGYKYPIQTKELLTFKFEENDYNLALKSGLKIPKENKVVEIEEHLSFAKDLIRPYVNKYRPELANNLKL